MAYWGRGFFHLNAPGAALQTLPLCMLAALLFTRALLADRRRGLVAAGAVAGLSILFKQSLGLASALAMGLAIWGLGMLDEPPARRRVRGATALALGAWALAALLPLAPVRSYLGWRDYALHFLPLHGLMALVAAAVVRRGVAGSPPRLLARGAWPLLGAVVAPAGAALLYASWGSLGAALEDMFLLPQRIEDYYLPVGVPPVGAALLALGALLLAHAGLLGLRGKRLPALGAAAAGIAAVGAPLLGFGVDPRVFELGIPLVPHLLAASLVGVEPFAIALAAIALLAWPLWQHASAPLAPRLRAALALLFFQLLLCFQVFPRAGLNSELLLPALTPLLAFALERWSRVGAPPGASRTRRAAALALVLALPVGLVSHQVELPFARASAPVAVGLPRTRGIALPPQEHAQLRLGEVRRLLEFVQELEPPQAPLLLLNNEAMIVHLSGRAPLDPTHEFHLHSLGWGLLPAAERPALDQSLLARLRATPDTIVIERDDPTSERIRSSLPLLLRFVRRHYEPLASFGPHRVLRRRDAPAGGA
jgi:hypothetical protein